MLVVKWLRPWASKREVKGSSHGQGKNGICVRTKWLISRKAVRDGYEA